MPGWGGEEEHGETFFQTEIPIGTEPRIYFTAKTQSFRPYLYKTPAFNGRKILISKFGQALTRQHAE